MKSCNPNKDVENDLGNFAYVTGNGGVNPNDNDLDGGSNYFDKSEIKAMGFDSMEIDFNYWFLTAEATAHPMITLTSA